VFWIMPYDPCLIIIQFWSYNIIRPSDKGNNIFSMHLFLPHCLVDDTSLIVSNMFMHSYYFTIVVFTTTTNLPGHENFEISITIWYLYILNRKYTYREIDFKRYETLYVFSAILFLTKYFTEQFFFEHYTHTVHFTHVLFL
jgi:hypothetical protein